LFKENSELKELNNTFKDKDIVVSQKEEIKKLEEFLGQKEVFIADLKNTISNNEKIINQTKTDKKRTREIKRRRGRKIAFRKQNTKNRTRKSRAARTS